VARSEIAAYSGIVKAGRVTTIGLRNKRRNSLWVIPIQVDWAKELTGAGMEEPPVFFDIAREGRGQNAIRRGYPVDDGGLQALRIIGSGG
jgi:hypothetical protein